MRSLFVLSLPRSLSSTVYDAARAALGLRAPTWTTAGELLNNDRHALYGGLAADEGIKYLRPAHAPALCERIRAFLDDVVRPEGHAYKDVVHPFIMASWPGLSRHPTLIVERPLADVLTAVASQGWRYPGHAIDRVAPTDDQITEGLLLAERALAAIPAERVQYDALLHDEGHLHDALCRLYPDADVPPPRYLDRAFADARARALRRRTTPEYRAAQARIAAVRARLDPPAGSPHR